MKGKSLVFYNFVKPNDQFEQDTMLKIMRTHNNWLIEGPTHFKKTDPLFVFFKTI